MRELNVVQKTWRSEYLKIALVYPNVYSSIAGLTVQTLYHHWNKVPNVICERFFLPSTQFSHLFSSGEKKRQKGGKKKSPTAAYSARQGEISPGKSTPPLKSIESGITLDQFDIIAFTVSYELDLPNILWFLDNAHIPIKSADRRKDPSKIYPIIIAGGPVIRSNPLPIFAALDAAFIGEIEPVNDQFLNLWFQSYENNLNPDYGTIQADFRQKLPKIPGFLVPTLDHILSLENLPQTARVYVKNLDDFSHPLRQIIPHFEHGEENPLPFGESFYLEVNRGCPHQCRFCLTGFQLNPFRNRSLPTLKKIISEGIRKTGVNKIVLIGASVTDHPRFDELCEFMIGQGLEFSVPSLRVDTLTEKRVSLLKRAGIKTVAVAPETGSDRLRRKVGKKITNAEILSGITLLRRAGIPNIKLYILYGLPFEIDEDLMEIVSLTQKIAALGYAKGAVRLSINPFIPKAHTPFESYIDMYRDPKVKELKRKFNLINKELSGSRQITIETLPPEEAYVQSFLSLGDFSMAALIREGYHTGHSAKRWYKAITHKPYLELVENLITKIDGSIYMSRWWNFLDLGVTPQFLEKEYGKAEKD